MPTSPAINAIPEGTNGCGDEIEEDQRGIKRPRGKGCDGGAFERKRNDRFLNDWGTKAPEEEGEAFFLASPSLGA